MATTTGQGVAPNLIDLGVVKGLFYERFGQAGQSALAQKIAPIVDLQTDEGSYLAEPASFLGVNLVDAPNSLDEVSLEATNYNDLSVSFEDRAFRLKRYQAGQFILSDRQAGKLRRQHAFELEDRVEYRFRTRLEAIHTHQAMNAATTSSNFNSTYDPGNLSTASFDLIGAIDTMLANLADQGVDDTAPLLLIGNPAAIGLVQKLDQIRNHFGAPNANFVPSMDILGSILSDYAGRPVEIVKASNRYKLGNGTFAYSATANVLSWVIAGGGMQQGLLKTVTVSDPDSEMFSIRSQRNERLPGTEIFADGYWDLHVGDKSAGVCWTGIAA